MALLLVNSGIFACILLIYVTIVFLIAQIKRDNSVMDIAYGPAFFVTSLIMVLLTGTTGLLPFVIVGMMGVWSTRLALRILKKNWGKPEDARYAAWRTAWMQKGRLYFVIRSYLQINLLQGFIIMTVALPFIIAISFPEALVWPLLILGALIYMCGLIIETIADWQLDAFIARKKAGTESANLMVTGLFHYSRRPNYFGETLIWWGQAVMVLASPVTLLALVSPLMITYIVTKVTGPMLEAIFLQKFPEEYRAYMDRTSYFIPLPPKS